MAEVGLPQVINLYPWYVLVVQNADSKGVNVGSYSLVKNDALPRSVALHSVRWYWAPFVVLLDDLVSLPHCHIFVD